MLDQITYEKREAVLDQLCAATGDALTEVEASIEVLHASAADAAAWARLADAAENLARIARAQAVLA